MVLEAGTADSWLFVYPRPIERHDDDDDNWAWDIYRPES